MDAVLAFLNLKIPNFVMDVVVFRSPLFQSLPIPYYFELIAVLTHAIS
jgi:hypothetical protein